MSAIPTHDFLDCVRREELADIFARLVLADAEAQAIRLFPIPAPTADFLRFTSFIARDVTRSVLGDEELAYVPGMCSSMAMADASRPFGFLDDLEVNLGRAAGAPKCLLWGKVAP